MNFIEEFIARGFFHQATDLEQLTQLFSSQKISAYIGFDPTATSLHVGNLMQIMILRLLQKHGHRPIIIVGGATAKIGDPSGKDEMRKVLSEHEIANNIAGIRESIGKFVNFTDEKALLLNNDQWLSKLNFISYLRDYGRHFSINRMLKFDSVKLRLEREQNLSFLEFNYMLLQAFDFVELHKSYNCRVQLGGSDQWGNIINGVELNRRLGLEEVFGITTPLITTANGAKMGKSVNGAVWLNKNLLSPYDYYQFWRNTDDRDVIRFLKIYTDLDLELINQYNKYEGNKINDIKKILAFEATKLCHGIEEAEKAQETAIKIFEEKNSSENLPTINLSSSELEGNVPVYTLFLKSGLVESGGEAKRLIKGKGAKINDQTILDENLKIDKSFFANQEYIKLSAGKKKHALVRFIN